MIRWARLNIFATTEYQCAEEDRLTNALMAVLRHSDTRVLRAFLALVIGDAEADRLNLESVEFELQPAFSKSRPDAEIQTPDLRIVIETKRGGNLDEDQLERHHRHLRRARTPAVLVALTNASVQPPVVSRLDQLDERVRVRHLRWETVLRMVSQFERLAAQHSATNLLLDQLEDYLRASGYTFFEGLDMKDVTEYALTAIRAATLQKRAEQQVEGLLATIKRHLEARAPAHPRMTQRPWRLGRFKPHVDSHRFHFPYLEAESEALGDGVRYRILPWVSQEDGLQVHYYLTSSEGAPRFNAMVRALKKHKSDIDGPFVRFETWRSKSARIFHISKQVPDGSLTRLQDDDVLDEVIKDIVRLFEQVEGVLRDSGLAI